MSLFSGQLKLVKNQNRMGAKFHNKVGKEVWKLRSSLCFKIFFSSNSLLILPAVRRVFTTERWQIFAESGAGSVISNTRNFRRTLCQALILKMEVQKSFVIWPRAYISSVAQIDLEGRILIPVGTFTYHTFPLIPKVVLRKITADYKPIRGA